MSRNLTNRFWEAITGAVTDEQFLLLTVITHPALSESIRAASDFTDVTSGGNLYVGFPFGVVLPSSEDDIPRATLTIQNVDSRIGKVIREVYAPIDVTLKCVLRDEPDEEIFSYDFFKLRNISGDGQLVQGNLSMTDYTVIAAGRNAIRQQDFPGLYK